MTEETIGTVLFERISGRAAAEAMHSIAQEMAMEVESQAPDAYRAKSALRRWSRRLHEEADLLEARVPEYFPYVEE